MTKHVWLGLLGVAVAGVIMLTMLGHDTAEAPALVDTPDTSTTTSDQSQTAATNTSTAEDVGTPMPAPTTPKPANPGATPATFTGILSAVNTGCFADGECYAVVGGKHVTLTIGWSQETVGTIVGAPSIGDLESYIGESATVYAKLLPDGTYTLYGNDAYYLAVTPKPVTGCVVGGCSSHLCIEAGSDIASTCEWTERYSCYQQATCERQPSGQCGWTETPTLLQCIADADQSSQNPR